MNPERFFKNPRMPYAELRYSTHSARVFKPHLHKSLSIGAIDRGVVNYTVVDHQNQLIPGTLALINPDTLHSCNAEKGFERNYYMLYLDIEYCLKIQQSLWDVDQFCPMTSIRCENEELYKSYIMVMTELLENTSHLLKKEQLLADLLLNIFLKCCKPQPATTSSVSTVELKNFLSKNLQEDVTLQDVSLKLDMNPYTLLRQFKAEYNITPHAYRMNCRIEKARKLLQDGKDIGDTALACGFFDQSHFHKYFKAATTVTPREYLVNFLQ